MKKIESIIDSCNECRYCIRYNRPDQNFGCAFICENAEKLICIDSRTNHTHLCEPGCLPEWCPLENYNSKNEG
nr:MAG TPA: hypothetical protein [Caudoviricetes sp.]